MCEETRGGGRRLGLLFAIRADVESNMALVQVGRVGLLAQVEGAERIAHETLAIKSVCTEHAAKSRKRMRANMQNMLKASNLALQLCRPA